MDTEADAARRAWRLAENRRVQSPVGSPAWREAVWTATLERELYMHLSRIETETSDSRIRRRA